MAILSIIPKLDSVVWIKINCSLTLIALIFLLLNYIDKGLRYYEVFPEPERPIKIKGTYLPTSHSASRFRINCTLAILPKLSVAVVYFPVRMECALQRKETITNAFVQMKIILAKTVKMVIVPIYFYEFILLTNQRRIFPVKVLERIRKALSDTDELYEKYTLSNGNSLFWKYANKLRPLSKYYNKKIYDLQDHVINDDSLYPINDDIIGRSLPPVPPECPTPMGIKGKPVKIHSS